MLNKGKNFVEDARFEVTPNGGTRTDSDSDGSTWEIRVKEGESFDYESTDNPMGVVTIKVTATDKGGYSVDAYFTIEITDVATGTGDTAGNKNPGDPQYQKPSDGESGGSSDPDLEDPTVEGLEDADGDIDSEDGPVIEPPKDGGAFIDEDDLIGLTIDDDLLGDFVLAIDDGIDIA